MNKKETAEIRKQFTPENCAIDRICGCYVNNEKEKINMFNQSFLSLDEEECFKYFDIFKKTISGSIGKNLLTIDFPANQEQPGGTQHALMELKRSRLQDDVLITEFFDRIIESYEYPENYLIVLIHAVYDIPGKSADGSTVFDDSDYVYDHLLLSICPVKLSKPGLAYDEKESRIACCTRTWTVDKPDTGFLFPAFNDRTEDVHHALYYTRKSSEVSDGILSNILGGNIPMTAEEQKEAFHKLLEDLTNDTVPYDTMRNIHENLLELLEEHKTESEPLLLNKPDILRLLKKSGLPDSALNEYDQTYDKYIRNQNGLLAANMTNDRAFQIDMSDVKIQVKTDRTDLIERKVIDGRTCLVIDIETDVKVNDLVTKA